MLNGHIFNTNICPNFVLFGRADSSSAAASESNTRGEGLTEFGKVRAYEKKLQVLDKPCKRTGTSKQEVDIVKTEQANGLTLERMMMMMMTTTK
jgi:hypothetical protein